MSDVPYPTRYYVLNKASDTYFRVLDGGRYERWDPLLKAWVHVVSPDARDYYSRAIENGDDCWEVEQADVH